jgi:transposase
MPGTLSSKIVNGKTYYYYRESYRAKVNPQDEGKTKGSGKSQVKSKSIYLGSAETILSWKFATQGPLSIRHRSFGLVAGAYQTAKEFGLIDILRKHIEGRRYGTERWIYFFITILNRLDRATSKNKMRSWIKKTILPDLLDIEVSHLTSKKYWYVTDDVLSEAQLKEKRKAHQTDADDLFCGLDDEVFQKIEQELFDKVCKLLPVSAGSLVYDTTNFFTFFEAIERSELAQTGHNKEARHHLRQVGLTMALDKSTGIPFYHEVYRGNSQDANTFYRIVADLLNRINQCFQGIDELVLILDKGNNKRETFDFLKGKIEWIGSLVPTQHDDLLSVPIDEYEGLYKGMKTLRRVKAVMGHKCVLVMAYNPKLERKQKHSLTRGIKKLEEKLTEKYDSYKNKPSQLTSGLTSILENSRYKKFVKLSVDKEGLKLESDQAYHKEHEKRFGKNLVFTSKENAETAWIIEQYKEKDSIEKVFRDMKDPELIRIRPLRHWTDTKIRAYIFCCVMSFILIRLMQHKTRQAGIGMSANLLKEELSDVYEILMIYQGGRAERKISTLSSVQKKLYDIFHLREIEERIVLHYF